MNTSKEILDQQWQARLDETRQQIAESQRIAAEHDAAMAVARQHQLDLVAQINVKLAEINRLVAQLGTR